MQAHPVADLEPLWDAVKAAYASVCARGLVPLPAFFEHLAKHLHVEVRELAQGERGPALKAGNEVVVACIRVLAHVDVNALAAALASQSDRVHGTTA